MMLAVRSPRARVGSAGIALVALIALSGCQAGSPAASPTTAVAETPTQPSTQTPDPTRTVPEPPVAGGCGGLFSDAEVGRITAGATVIEPDELWDVAIETIGGLSCSFRSDSMAGDVIMLPAARAADLEQGGPEEQFGAPGCERDYGDVVCSASEVAGGTWVLVTMPHAGEDVPGELPEVQAAVLRAMATVVRGSVPAGVNTRAATLDCPELAERISVAGLLGGGEIFPTRIEEGQGPLERRIADATGASVRCDWSELDNFRELGVVRIPGGAWAWDRVVEQAAGSRDVDIAGIAARLWPKPSGETGILIGDDRDLVWVWGRDIGDTDLMSAATAVVGG